MSLRLRVVPSLGVSSCVCRGQGREVACFPGLSLGRCGVEWVLLAQARLLTKGSGACGPLTPPGSRVLGPRRPPVALPSCAHGQREAGGFPLLHPAWPAQSTVSNAGSMVPAGRAGLLGCGALGTPLLGRLLGPSRCAGEPSRPAVPALPIGDPAAPPGPELQSRPR